MRFTLPYNLYRIMGITGLFLIGYIVVIGIFGNVDISPLLPNKLAASIQDAWPRLPIFKVQRETLANGQGVETYFTVPTRQLTPKELAQIRNGRPLPPWFQPPAKVAETEKSVKASSAR